MTCSSCKAAIDKRFTEVPGVEYGIVSLNGLLEVAGNITDEAVIRVVTGIFYVLHSYILFDSEQSLGLLVLRSLYMFQVALMITVATLVR